MFRIEFDMETIKHYLSKSKSINTFRDLDPIVTDVYNLHEAAKTYPRNNELDITKSMFNLYLQTKELAQKYFVGNNEKDAQLTQAIIFMIVTESFAASISYREAIIFGAKDQRQLLFLDKIFTLVGLKIFDPHIIKYNDTYALNVIAKYLSRRCIAA